MESKYVFQKKGNQFRITSKENLDLHDKLPVGTYCVKFDECRSEYYLENIDDFKIKGKIYGNVTKNSDRILRTFLDRSRSTGVLLAGDKGSGKTLLAHFISITAAREKEIPTIVINQPYFGDEFNLFIQSIGQPAIILFDEFEKVYKMHDCSGNQQEHVLTLFDGVYSSQKLFLLTCNDKSQIDDHMMNRPGRIYYMLEYNGLETSFVKEYCEDNLLRKDYIPSVCAISAMFRSFNFDMLKAMVEDMNRYDESPSEVLSFLNIRPDSCGRETFTVKLLVKGEKVKTSSRWTGNPLNEVIRIDQEPTEDDFEAAEEGGEEGRENKGNQIHYFLSSHLQKLDSETRVHEFKNNSGSVLILTPVPPVSFSLAQLNNDKLASLAQKMNISNPDDDTDHEEKKLEAMYESRWY